MLSFCTVMQMYNIGFHLFCRSYNKIEDNSFSSQWMLRYIILINFNPIYIILAASYRANEQQNTNNFLFIDIE